MPGIFNPNNYSKIKMVLFSKASGLDIPPFIMQQHQFFFMSKCSLFSPVTISGLSQNIIAPTYLSATMSNIKLQNISWYYGSITNKF